MVANNLVSKTNFSLKRNDNATFEKTSIGAENNSTAHKARSTICCAFSINLDLASIRKQVVNM